MHSGSFELQCIIFIYCQNFSHIFWAIALIILFLPHKYSHKLLKHRSLHLRNTKTEFTSALMALIASCRPTPSPIYGPSLPVHCLSSDTSAWTRTHWSCYGPQPANWCSGLILAHPCPCGQNHLTNPRSVTGMYSVPEMFTSISTNEYRGTKAGRGDPVTSSEAQALTQTLKGCHRGWQQPDDSREQFYRSS